MGERSRVKHRPAVCGRGTVCDNVLNSMEGNIMVKGQLDSMEFVKFAL